MSGIDWIADEPPEERDSEYEARWARGGLGFGFSFNDLLVDEKANEAGAEFFPQQDSVDRA